MWHNTSLTKDFTRGGQTTLHNLRMILQIIRKLVIIFLITFVSFNSYWWYREYALYASNLPLAFQWMNAEVRILLGHTQDVLDLTLPDGNHYRALPHQVVENPLITEYLHTLTASVKEGICDGLCVALAVSLATTILLAWIGKRQRRQKIIRGAYFSDNKTLRKLLHRKNLASHFTLAQVPIIKNSERSHFLISGTPGTGKSVCMAELLDQVRTQKQRAIVYDKCGDFVTHFYREGKDILLNPLDERSPPWEIWSECRHISDYDTLASALMPLPPGAHDPFWINAARTIFSAAAFQLSHQKDKSMQQLLNYLFTADLNTLTHLLKGTEAEILVSEKIEKTALSVKTVLSTSLKSMKYLKHSDKPFSIRRWIERDDDDAWLFVTSRSDKHESLKPLISAWLEIAGSSLMSLNPDKTRRIWMSLDELPSLHRLPYLSSLLAESRKFGGCLVVSVQSMAQLKDLYGNNAAEAISGLCNTRIFFRTPEAHTAEWVSKSLGECEVDEPREGFSYGANAIRDGVSLHRQRVIRPLVMASQITQLPDLHAYLKLPGDWPVTTLTFNYRDRLVLAPAFIEQLTEKNADTPTTEIFPAKENHNSTETPLTKTDRFFQLREQSIE